MIKSNILNKELIVNDYSLIVNIKSEHTIYTENFYESLYLLDIQINDCLYKNYYLKINDIDMLFDDETLLNIINNLYIITFNHNKYIGEVNDKKLIYDKYIEEQLNKINPINCIYKEYKKSNNKLKYEAFFEIYFSTHLIPLEIIKDYIKKDNNIFDITKVEKEIKKNFVGKTQELRLKINKLERQYEKLNTNNSDTNIENRIKICNCFLSKIEQINKKDKAYKSILKQLDDTKKSKDNILVKIKKTKELNNKIKYIESRFNYDDEVNKLKLNVKEKTKKDIINNYKVSLNVIEEKINNYIRILKKDISNNKRRNSSKNNIIKEIDSYCFDDLYLKIEQEVK